MKIKICGLSNVVDARVALKAGADALGFVMGGRVLPPEVEAPAQNIRLLLQSLEQQSLEQKVESFLVTHLLAAKEILALAGYLGVSGIQVSEPLDTAALQELRQNFSGCIIKTLAVQGAQSFSELRRIEPYCDWVLLDSCAAGYIGGTGVPNDWQLGRELVQATSRPVYLAGGLNPNNVCAAIRALKPAGVDVSTGVSCFAPDYLRKDRKDPLKIQSFINNVRTRHV